MRRIEKKIRKTSVNCLRSLIKMEANAKDLVANDDKLKMILRPVLLCLQQDFKIFSVPFLSILKQLLKMLYQCFNKALSDKLLEHLNIRLEMIPNAYQASFVYLNIWTTHTTLVAWVLVKIWKRSSKQAWRLRDCLRIWLAKHRSTILQEYLWSDLLIKWQVWRINISSSQRIYRIRKPFDCFWTYWYHKKKKLQS